MEMNSKWKREKKNEKGGEERILAGHDEVKERKADEEMRKLRKWKEIIRGRVVNGDELDM